MLDPEPNFSLTVENQEDVFVSKSHLGKDNEKQILEIKKGIDKHTSLSRIPFCDTARRRWIKDEIIFLVYLTWIYEKDWSKITEEFNRSLDQNRNSGSIQSRFACISVLKLGKLKKIVFQNDYQPNFALIKVKHFLKLYKILFFFIKGYTIS